MKGFKRVGEVEICPRPCCQGYHEVNFINPCVCVFLEHISLSMLAWVIKMLSAQLLELLNVSFCYMGKICLPNRVTHAAQGLAQTNIMHYVLNL